MSDDQTYGYDLTSDDSGIEPETPKNLYMGKDLILSPAARTLKFAPAWYQMGKELNLTAHTWYILLTNLRPWSLIYGSGFERFCDRYNIPFDDEKTLRQFSSKNRPIIKKIPTRCKFKNWRGRQCDMESLYEKNGEYCVAHNPSKVEIPSLPDEITSDIEEFNQLVTE